MSTIELMGSALPPCSLTVGGFAASCGAEINHKGLTSNPFILQKPSGDRAPLLPIHHSSMNLSDAAS
jgi:hypothetical protein